MDNIYSTTEEPRKYYELVDLGEIPYTEVCERCYFDREECDSIELLEGSPYEFCGIRECFRETEKVFELTKRYKLKEYVRDPESTSSLDNHCYSCAFFFSGCKTIKFDGIIVSQLCRENKYFMEVD